MTNGLSREGESDLKNLMIILGLLLFGCAPTNKEVVNASAGLSEQELKERVT